MSSKKNVVVVGAGFAGTAVASGLAAKLDSRYHIILISSRPYSIPLPAALRLVVSESAKLEETAFVPLDRLFKKGNGEVKVGVVKSIEPKDTQSGGDVLLEDGERISYEALVIASGSKWKDPVDFPLYESEVLPYVRTWRSKFASARHVVIAGGGAVGAGQPSPFVSCFPDSILMTELAGELKDEYPVGAFSLPRISHLICVIGQEGDHSPGRSSASKQHLPNLISRGSCQASPCSWRRILFQRVYRLPPGRRHRWRCHPRRNTNTYR